MWQDLVPSPLYATAAAADEPAPGIDADAAAPVVPVALPYTDTTAESVAGAKPMAAMSQDIAPRPVVVAVDAAIADVPALSTDAEAAALVAPVEPVAPGELSGPAASVASAVGAKPSAAMSQEIASRGVVVAADAASADAATFSTDADKAAPAVPVALPGPADTATATAPVTVTATTVASATPSAATSQDLTPRPVVVAADATAADAAALSTDADAAAPVATAALPGPAAATVTAATATLVAGGKPMAAMSQDVTPRALVVGGEEDGVDVVFAPAAQAPKPVPRSTASAPVTVVASAPEPSSRSNFLALAVPNAPQLDAAGAIQLRTAVAENGRPVLSDAVFDPVEMTSDTVMPLPTSQGVVGLADDQAAPLVSANPSVVQALASAAAEASARLSGVAAEHMATQKLQLVIDNGEAGRIRMDMVFSEPGHAALVLHASSEAQSRLLGQRSQQLVDTLQAMGLVVQVSVRQDGASGEPSDGRSQSGQGQGTAAVASTNAARRTTGSVTPVSAIAPRVNGGTRLDLYA